MAECERERDAEKARAIAFDDEARESAAELQAQRVVTIRARHNELDSERTSAGLRSQLESHRAVVEAAIPFVASLHGAWAGPETLHPKISRHPVAGAPYRRFRETLDALSASEPIGKAEADKTIGKGDRVVVNNSRPRFAGHRGEVIFAEGKSARVRLDGNVDPDDDVWFVLENIGREPETAEAGTVAEALEKFQRLAPNAFADLAEVGIELPDKHALPWKGSSLGEHDVDVYSADGRCVVTCATRQLADYVVSRCNASQRAEPVAQAIDSRELKHIYEAASLLRCLLELQGAWYGFENAQQCNRFDKWREADRRLASYGFEEPVAKGVERAELDAVILAEPEAQGGAK